MSDMDTLVCNAAFELLDEIKRDMKKLANDEGLDVLEECDFTDSKQFDVIVSVTYPATGRVMKVEKRYRVEVTVKVTDE